MHDVEDAKRQKSSKDGDSNMCQICFESWTSHGAHQLCSLPCGHFFGKSCVEKTLANQTNKAKHCPLCNTKVKLSEIRKHFAIDNFATRDSSVEEGLREELKMERAARVAAEMALGRAKVQLAAFEKIPGSKHTPVSSWSAHASIKVNLGRSRAACWISSDLGGVVSSFDDTSNMYGLCKIHPDLGGAGAIQTCGHHLPIKDIAFQSASPVSRLGCLAAASLDGSMILCDTNLTQILKANAGEPVWSITFGKDQSHQFLVGTQHGRLKEFDMRNCTREVRTLFQGHHPIHSLHRSSSDAVCFSSFTSVHVQWLDGLETPAKSVDSLSMRQQGSQYMSMACTEAGSFALATRACGGSSIQVGVLQGTQLKKDNTITSDKAKPFGRIACNDELQVLVPDEESKTCTVLPHQIALASNATSSWFCGDSGLCMFTNTLHSVEFFKPAAVCSLWIRE